MKEYIKESYKDIVNRNRIWDAALTLSIILIILYVAFGINVDEPSTRVILGISAVVIFFLTVLATILLKACIAYTAKKKDLLNHKGFTLVELIVVIVVLAILIAALTPAVMGVIGRARYAADEADARTVLMAASLITVGRTAIPAQTGDTNFQDLIESELTGGNLVPGALFTVHMENNFPVSVVLTTNARSNRTVTVGRNPVPTGTGIQTRTYTVP